MAKLFIDGEVVDVPEGMEQTIEEVLYGENSQTLLCDSVEEFQEASTEFVEAELLASLQHIEGFQVLVARAQREFAYACEAEQGYDLTDKRSEKLKINRIKAKAILDWLRQTVENATSVQKPVLRKK